METKKSQTTWIPRGIRNNNPLNIRRTQTTTWWGQKTEDLTDEAFCEFEEMKYCYRAAWLLLKRYFVKHGCTTIEKIISRWAPPSDNNHTDNYIDYVCEACGISRNLELSHPADNPELWVMIIRSMAYMESGITPYDYDRALFQGMIMALKDDVR